MKMALASGACSVCSVFDALATCYEMSQGKDDVECDFVRFQLEQGTLWARWDALKCRLVIKEMTLTPRGRDDEHVFNELDAAVNTLLLTFPKFASLRGVVVLNVLQGLGSFIVE